jgi:hypothetical protein
MGRAPATPAGPASSGGEPAAPPPPRLRLGGGARAPWAGASPLRQEVRTGASPLHSFNRPPIPLPCPRRRPPATAAPAPRSGPHLLGAGRARGGHTLDRAAPAPAPTTSRAVAPRRSCCQPPGSRRPSSPTQTAVFSAHAGQAPPTALAPVPCLPACRPSASASVGAAHARPPTSCPLPALPRACPLCLPPRQLSPLASPAHASPSRPWSPARLQRLEGAQSGRAPIRPRPAWAPSPSPRHLPSLPTTTPSTRPTLPHTQPHPVRPTTRPPTHPPTRRKHRSFSPNWTPRLPVPCVAPAHGRAWLRPRGAAPLHLPPAPRHDSTPLPHCCGYAGRPRARRHRERGRAPPPARLPVRPPRSRCRRTPPRVPPTARPCLIKPTQHLPWPAARRSPAVGAAPGAYSAPAKSNKLFHTRFWSRQVSTKPHSALSSVVPVSVPSRLAPGAANPQRLPRQPHPSIACTLGAPHTAFSLTPACPPPSTRGPSLLGDRAPLGAALPAAAAHSPARHLNIRLASCPRLRRRGASCPHLRRRGAPAAARTSPRVSPIKPPAGSHPAPTCQHAGSSRRACSARGRMRTDQRPRPSTAHPRPAAARSES